LKVVNETEEGSWEKEAVLLLILESSSLITTLLEEHEPLFPLLKLNLEPAATT